MIKLNLKDGYVANWTRPPNDVENSIEYHGELPEDFTDNSQFYKLVDGELVFDADKLAQREEAESAQEELASLYEWFAHYDIEVLKWVRGERMGLPRDDIDIAALDAEAEHKREKIKELRALCSTIPN